MSGDRSSPIDVEITFREPVTMRIFLEACEALGVDREAAWKNPLLAGDLIPSSEVTLEMGRRFLEIVLTEVPELDDEHLKAVVAYCTHGEQGFFAMQRKRYLEENGERLGMSMKQFREADHG